MQLMPGDDITQCTNRDWCIVGDPETLLRLGLQTAKKQDRRAADMFEFSHQLAPGPTVEVGLVDIRILIETRERRMVIAGEPQGPVHENPLAIDDVAEEFLDAPFARRIAMQRAGL